MDLIAGLGKYVIVAAIVMAFIGLLGYYAMSGKVMGKSPADLLYQERNFKQFYPLIIGVVLAVIVVAVVGILI